MLRRACVRRALYRGEPPFLAKLRSQSSDRACAFTFPSVMSVDGFCNKVEQFVATVHKEYINVPETQRRKLQQHLAKAQASAGAGRVVQTADLPAICEAVRDLKTGPVKAELQRRGVFDGTGFMTPLVPYRVARDIILARIPRPADREFFKQNDLRYVEADVFAKPKLWQSGPARTPAVCIMGHIDHGKTTLLDTLQKSSLVAGEAGKITQSIRAFTIGIDPHRYPRHMTFLDTPGHKIFAEMRLTGQHAADYVLLIVALDEGVRGQTEEVVQSALHFKRPVVVAFNKVDLYSDPGRLAAALTSACEQLRNLGLAVTLVDNDATLDAVAGSDNFEERYIGSASTSSVGATENAKAELKTADDTTSPDPAAEAAPEKKSGMVGSMLKRKKKKKSTSKSTTAHAIGVCVSGKSGTNIELLLTAVQRLAQARPVRGDPNLNPRQAIVIEGHKRGSKVVVSCVVRNGTLEVGTPFIADQSHGVVERLEDQWGRSIPRALPGEAVNVVGVKSGGSPGSGTHLIEVPSSEAATQVFEFRRRLQVFVERCPEHVALLRPEGRESKFLHVGNYGQLKEDKSRQYELLFKQKDTAQVRSTKEAMWQASAPREDEEPKTEAEAEARVRQMEHVPILLKVDSWHSARLLMRELPRLMTKDVFIQVVSVGFGTVQRKELGKLQYDLVLSYRAPKLRDSQVAFQLKEMGVHYMEFTVYSDLIAWVKDYVVERQAAYQRKKQKEAADDANFGEELLAAVGLTTTMSAPRGKQALTRVHDADAPPPRK